LCQKRSGITGFRRRRITMRNTEKCKLKIAKVKIQTLRKSDQTTSPILHFIFCILHFALSARRFGGESQ